MKYSLINVAGIQHGKIYGYWLIDHIGTLDSAIECAIATEKVNSNKIDVAVVDQVTGPCPNLDTHYFLNRLDIQRNRKDELNNLCCRNPLPQRSREGLGSAF